MTGRILFARRHCRDGSTVWNYRDKEITIGDYVRDVSRFRNRLCQITSIVDGEIFATGERMDGSDIVTRKIGELVELNDTRGAMCTACGFQTCGCSTLCYRYLTDRREKSLVRIA